MYSRKFRSPKTGIYCLFNKKKQIKKIYKMSVSAE